MIKNYNFWASSLFIFSFVMALYSLYSNIKNTWLVAPPIYILLCLTLMSIFLCIVGMSTAGTKWEKVKSLLILLPSTLLVITFIFVLLFTSFFSPKVEYIKTVNSPDNSYSIDFYKWDAGATGTFGVKGVLNGPLWFEKEIYRRNRVTDINVEWANNHEIIINNHTLNLNKGDYP